MVRPGGYLGMNTQFERALDAAHRCIDDGSIDNLCVSRDEYGYRTILAHSDQGWNTWYSERYDKEEYSA